MATPTLSLNRTYTLQDGKMNSVAISESNIDDNIIISQNGNDIHIPRAYLEKMSMILSHIQGWSI